jgi:hypothetical protein
VPVPVRNVRTGSQRVPSASSRIRLTSSGDGHSRAGSCDFGRSTPVAGLTAIFPSFFAEFSAAENAP